MSVWLKRGGRYRGTADLHCLGPGATVRRRHSRGWLAVDANPRLAQAQDRAADTGRHCRSSRDTDAFGGWSFDLSEVLVQDSNLRQTSYELVALPTELSNVAAMPGLEPG